MREVIGTPEFISRFGNSRLKFIGNYKGTKRYKVINDDDSVIEFVSKTLKYEFLQEMYMEIVSYYITGDIQMFNNEGDDFTVYRVHVDIR